MFHRKGLMGFSVVVFLLFIFGLWLPSFSAEKSKKDLPERAISVSPEYTGVIIPRGEGVSVDLIVANKGKRDEDIDLSVVEVPNGWSAWIKTYSYAVSGVHVKSDKSRSLTFRAEPEKKDIPAGTYRFKIRARTRDGKLTDTCYLTITIKKKEEEKRFKNVEITTSYPVLRGPTDASFEFSIEVENKMDKDTIFNLSAKGPPNWEINFKPAYEEKYISSLRVKSDRSESMAVEVKPYPLSKPGKYPIKVKVSSEKATAEADLMVILTGIYKLDVGTASGLLSLSALQGKEAIMSFYVKNSGSATLRNIKFLSFKPENWKVKFTPEKIDSLSPGEIKQIELSITPAEQALVGDYSVSISVEGEKVNKDMELRITVRASTAWTWIGIGIIVFVLAGLVTLFMKLGRR